MPLRLSQQSPPTALTGGHHPPRCSTGAPTQPESESPAFSPEQAGGAGQGGPWRQGEAHTSNPRWEMGLWGHEVHAAEATRMETRLSSWTSKGGRRATSPRRGPCLTTCKDQGQMGLFPRPILSDSQDKEGLGPLCPDVFSSWSRAGIHLRPRHPGNGLSRARAPSLCQNSRVLGPDPHAPPPEPSALSLTCP